MSEHSAENGLPAGLLDYFANRQAQESALTDRAWAALAPREQTLVREAAVMGFVRGQFYGTERRTPKDSAIVRDVLTEVRGFEDLYPTLNGLTRVTPPKADAMPDAESDAPPPLNEWLTEWAVEVTWCDWKKAGAAGPTSQYGPFEHPYQRDQFLATQRRDREIVVTRVLTRRAAYTPWVGPDTADPTTEEEREALLMAEWERINGRITPPGGSDA